VLDRELGLGDSHEGLWDLPADAPVGVDLRAWLGLDDQVIDVDLTPNRGDCFSVLGIAREVALINGLPLGGPGFARSSPGDNDEFPVEVRAPEACPRFVGRVIRGIRPDAVTPLWMREKLRRAGLRPIHPVVDVTNIVMLELGQPMHGFDLATLREGIIVRLAEAGEKIVAAGRARGGAGAGHAGDRRPWRAACGRRDHGRRGFRRVRGDARRVLRGGVLCAAGDRRAGAPARPAHRCLAALRARRGSRPPAPRHRARHALLLDIAGGEPGPVIERAAESHLPARGPCAAPRTARRAARPRDADAEVERILEGLGMELDADRGGLGGHAAVASLRHRLEVDLIEEVARIYGYDRLAEARGAGAARYWATPPRAACPAPHRRHARPAATRKS
jgi:phenylalanyl-tRNA synthetase beta chain